MQYLGVCKYFLLAVYLLFPNPLKNSGTLKGCRTPRLLRTRPLLRDLCCCGVGTYPR